MKVPVRRPNPRGQGARLRGELLDAASRLLEVGGRDAQLTLRGVAREAGVAAPSVYPHFANLDALMFALISHHLADLRAALENASAAPDQPPREQLRAMAHAYVRWGLDHPGLYTVIIEGRVLRHLTNEQELTLAGTDLFDLLTNLTAAVISTEGDPRLAATATWSSLHGVVALRSAKPAYPWPPLALHVDAVFETVWRSPPTPA